MKWYILAFVIVVMGSCFSDGNCIVTATSIMEIQFKKKIDPATDSFMAFTAIFISGDTVARDTITNTLALPLDIRYDTTTFVMARINILDSTITATDTLSVTYSRRSKVLGSNCGAFTFYGDLRIVKTSIDTARIKILNTSLAKDPSSLSYAINFQILY